MGICVSKFGREHAKLQIHGNLRQQIRARTREASNSTEFYVRAFLLLCFCCIYYTLILRKIQQQNQNFHKKFIKARDEPLGNTPCFRFMRVSVHALRFLRQSCERCSSSAPTAFGRPYTGFVEIAFPSVAETNNSECGRGGACVKSNIVYKL